jgi:AraC-like DNA-binding protein
MRIMSAARESAGAINPELTTCPKLSGVATRCIPQVTWQTARGRRSRPHGRLAAPGRAVARAGSLPGPARPGLAADFARMRHVTVAGRGPHPVAERPHPAAPPIGLAEAALALADAGGVPVPEPGLPLLLRGGLAFGMFDAGRDDEMATPAFRHRTVCLLLTASEAELWTNGRRDGDTRFARGSWIAHAPGDSFRAIGRSACRVLRVVIPESALGAAVAELGLAAGAVDIATGLSGPSPFLLGLADEMQAALGARSEPARLYAETLGGTFLHHLVVRHSSLAGTRRGRGGAGAALAPWRLRRATEFLEANLAADVSLQDLADEVGLSPHHLCTAFRRSTGLPPHRWLLARRIERAKELLAAGRLSLAEVALACGFASQQHFTVAFRRATGLTPGRMRREAIG